MVMVAAPATTADVADPPGGARAVARCRMLAAAPYSSMAAGLERTYLSPAFVETQRVVAAWMEQAGMVVSRDAAANLVGKYRSAFSSDLDAPALILGSHIDSVRDAGAFDGPLGVMLAIECVAALRSRGQRMAFPIHIYAFGDEEGSRFSTAMLTSRAVAGTLAPEMLDIADYAGISLQSALATLPEPLSIGDFADARHPPALAYLEAHIEQGPVLEARRLPLGTVTGIAAQLRHCVTVTGTAGHAGTNSMALRRDALAATAAMIAATEEIARGGSASASSLRGSAGDLVATVGSLHVEPGAANVVPGRVEFTLDVRAGTDAARDAASAMILARCAAIANTRGVEFEHRVMLDLAASPCDPILMGILDAAVEDTGQRPFRLVSGAGHDAMIMAALCPTAMLFIRCRGGVSHNPAEHVEVADAEAALTAMLGFIDRLESDV